MARPLADLQLRERVAPNVWYDPPRHRSLLRSPCVGHWQRFVYGRLRGGPACAGGWSDFQPTASQPFAAPPGSDSKEDITAMRQEQITALFDQQASSVSSQ